MLKPLTLCLAASLLALCFAAVSFAAPPNSSSVTDLIPQLETYVKYVMNQTGVPGLAIGIVYQDQVVYLNGFGVRKVGEKKPITPDTIFQLASVSKPLASTVVAALVGDGKVRFDDLIKNLDPGFELANPWVTNQLTIRDLLSHRSGLPEGSGDVLEDLGYSRPEILHRTRFLPLAGKFRTDYAYTNFGYTEGAIASIKSSDARWEDVADELLYKPLGMRSTSSRFSDYFNAENKAWGHVFESGKAVNRYLRQPDSEAPAGGVSSNVRDLTQWLRLQLQNGLWNGQQIVDADALKETHKPLILTNPDSGQTPTYYAMGWDVSTDARGKTILSHSGAFFIGAGTNVTLSQSDQLAIVVLTNATPTGAAEAIAKTFFDYYAYGHSDTDWLQLYQKAFADLINESNNASKDYSKLEPPSDPSPAQPLSSYVGQYFNRYYGTLEITAVGNQLYLRLPPRGASYPLAHWDGNTFTYRFEGESGIGTRGVDFSGENQVLIENLNTEGSGYFTKADKP